MVSEFDSRPFLQASGEGGFGSRALTPEEEYELAFGHKLSDIKKNKKPVDNTEQPINVSASTLNVVPNDPPKDDAPILLTPSADPPTTSIDNLPFPPPVSNEPADPVLDPKQEKETDVPPNLANENIKPVVKNQDAMIFKTPGDEFLSPSTPKENVKKKIEPGALQLGPGTSTWTPPNPYPSSADRDNRPVSSRKMTMVEVENGESVVKTEAFESMLAAELGKSNAEAKEAAQELEAIGSIPLKERLVSSQWDHKVHGIKELKTKYDANPLTAGSDKMLPSKLKTPLKDKGDGIVEYLSILSNLLSDKNPNVQRESLECLLFLVHQCQGNSCLKNDLKNILVEGQWTYIVEKLSPQPRLLQSVLDLFNLIVAVDSDADGMMDRIKNALNKYIDKRGQTTCKGPALKVATALFTIATNLVHNFGLNKFTNSITQMLPLGKAFAAVTDKNLKEAFYSFVSEVFLWTRSVDVIKAGIPDKQASEIERRCKELTDTPKPTPTWSYLDSRGTSSAEKKPGSPDAPKAEEEVPEVVISAYALMPAIDLATVFNAEKWESQLSSAKKWVDKRDLYEELVDILTKNKKLKVCPPTLQAAQMIFSASAPVVSLEPNVVVVSLAIKVVGLLAMSLRSGLPKNLLKNVLATLIGKLKDKNKSVQTSSLEALTSFLECSPMDSFIDDVVTGCNDKSPVVRENLMFWCTTALKHSSSTPDIISKCSLKLTNVAIANIEHASAPTRGAAAKLLIALSTSSPAVVNKAVAGMSGKAKQTAAEALARAQTGQDKTSEVPPGGEKESRSSNLSPGTINVNNVVPMKMKKERGRVTGVDGLKALHDTQQQSALPGCHFSEQDISGIDPAVPDSVSVFNCVAKIMGEDPEDSATLKLANGTSWTGKVDALNLVQSKIQIDEAWAKDRSMVESLIFFCKLLAKDFKENNTNLLKKILDLLIFIINCVINHSSEIDSEAMENKSILSSVPNSVISVPMATSITIAVLEKLSDARTGQQISDFLMSLAEVVTPVCLLFILCEPIRKYTTAKAQGDIIKLVTRLLVEFTPSAVPTMAVVYFLKTAYLLEKPVAQASANILISTLVKMKRLNNPSHLLSLFTTCPPKDKFVKPSLAKDIEKIPPSSQPLQNQNTRQIIGLTLDESTVPLENTIDQLTTSPGQFSPTHHIPETSNNSFFKDLISLSLLKSLADPDWKVRRDTITSLLTTLSHSQVVPTNQLQTLLELLNVLKSRISAEPNRAVAKLILEFCKLLASIVPADKSSALATAKIIVPCLIQKLGDKFMQPPSFVSDVLRAWIVSVGPIYFIVSFTAVGNISSMGSSSTRFTSHLSSEQKEELLKLIFSQGDEWNKIFDSGKLEDREGHHLTSFVQQLIADGFTDKSKNVRNLSLDFCLSILPLLPNSDLKSLTGDLKNSPQGNSAATQLRSAIIDLLQNYGAGKPPKGSNRADASYVSMENSLSNSLTSQCQGSMKRNDQSANRMNKINNNKNKNNSGYHGYNENTVNENSRQLTKYASKEEPEETEAVEFVFPDPHGGSFMYERDLEFYEFKRVNWSEAPGMSELENLLQHLQNHLHAELTMAMFPQLKSPPLSDNEEVVLLEEASAILEEVLFPPDDENNNNNNSNRIPFEEYPDWSSAISHRGSNTVAFERLFSPSRGFADLLIRWCVFCTLNSNLKVVMIGCNFLRMLLGKVLDCAQENKLLAADLRALVLNDKSVAPKEEIDDLIAVLNAPLLSRVQVQYIFFNFHAMLLTIEYSLKEQFLDIFLVSINVTPLPTELYQVALYMYLQERDPVVLEFLMNALETHGWTICDDYEQEAKLFTTSVIESPVATDELFEKLYHFLSLVILSLPSQEADALSEVLDTQFPDVREHMSAYVQNNVSILSVFPTEGLTGPRLSRPTEHPSAQHDNLIPFIVSEYRTWKSSGADAFHSLGQSSTVSVGQASKGETSPSGLQTDMTVGDKQKSEEHLTDFVSQIDDMAEVKDLDSDIHRSTEEAVKSGLVLKVRQAGLRLQDMLLHLRREKEGRSLPLEYDIHYWASMKHMEFVRTAPSHTDHAGIFLELQRLTTKDMESVNQAAIVLMKMLEQTTPTEVPSSNDPASKISSQSSSPMNQSKTSQPAKAPQTEWYSVCAGDLISACSVALGEVFSPANILKGKQNGSSKSFDELADTITQLTLTLVRTRRLLYQLSPSQLKGIFSTTLSAMSRHPLWQDSKISDVLVERLNLVMGEALMSVVSSRTASSIFEMFFEFALAPIAQGLNDSGDIGENRHGIDLNLLLRVFRRVMKKLTSKHPISIAKTNDSDPCKLRAPQNSHDIINYARLLDLAVQCLKFMEAALPYPWLEFQKLTAASLAPGAPPLADSERDSFLTELRDVLETCLQELFYCLFTYCPELCGVYFRDKRFSSAPDVHIEDVLSEAELKALDPQLSKLKDSNCSFVFLLQNSPDISYSCTSTFLSHCLEKLMNQESIHRKPKSTTHINSSSVSYFKKKDKIGSPTNLSDECGDDLTTSGTLGNKYEVPAILPTFRIEEFIAHAPDVELRELDPTLDGGWIKRRDSFLTMVGSSLDEEKNKKQKEKIFATDIVPMSETKKFWAEMIHKLKIIDPQCDLKIPSDESLGHVDFVLPPDALTRVAIRLRDLKRQHLVSVK